jgi:hypothetical protein
MLIAEALLLLLTDDRAGTTPPGAPVEIGLGGALLIELAAAGRVQFTEHQGTTVVQIIDRRPGGDVLLDEALRRLGEKTDETADQAVARIGTGMKDRVYEALAEQGIVHRESRRVWGLFPTTRWPVDDAATAAAVSTDVRAALFHGTPPTARVAALTSLLFALDQLGVVAPKADRKAATTRAKEIADGHVVGGAVAAAVGATRDAVTVAGVAATVAAAM